MIIIEYEKRMRLRSMFALGAGDDLIADRLGVSKNAVAETRKAMGLKRTRGTNTVGLKPREKGGKNKPTKQRVFKNRKEFKILYEYAKQLNGKNMSKLAKKFNVSREYVRQVVELAMDAGLLDGFGFIEQWEVPKQLLWESCTPEDIRGWIEEYEKEKLTNDDS